MPPWHGLHASTPLCLPTLNHEVPGSNGARTQRAANTENAENFPHHCDYVYMVASGVSQRLCQRPTFQEYVHGFEPRAVMPHHVTIHRIAIVINELQEEAQDADIQKFVQSFGGLECLGLQLDLWTDSNTHMCYAVLNLSRVLPAAGLTTHARVQSEVLEFEQFPNTAHTGDNIAEWIRSVLKRKKLKFDHISRFTPDHGAADGKAALKSIDGLQNKHDVCFLH